jgi:prepilin-type N-terminal cleavage/methylation domain-containing protein
MNIHKLVGRSRPGRRQSGGFTLIEIMIVVLIIGILIAMAIANFSRARESTYRKACMNNLRRIQYAKDSYMMDASLPISTPAASFTDAALYGPDKYLKEKPKCPGSGVYSVNDGGTLPTCNYQGGDIHSYGGDP